MKNPLRGVKSRLPSGRTLGAEALAAIPNAISNIPDGMASGILANVGPVNGLYTAFAGPIAGGSLSSTQLMVVSTTSAASLAAGSTLVSLPPEQRPGAMALLTLIAGVIMIAAAIMRLGRYTRFVSHSVMTGFITGVAVNIILGQLPDLAGAPSKGPIALAKAGNIILHPGLIDVPSLAIGVLAIVIMVVLDLTPLAAYGSLVAVIVPTAVVGVAGLESVQRVSDTGGIPRGFPIPSLPDFSHFSVSLLGGGLAVAIIILVQGAGVAESAPNPDGSRSDANRDFLAQGGANALSAFFRGIPAGASVGSTALNISSGARTRASAILSGVWILLVLVFLSSLIGLVAMPTLAALLIVAAVGAIRPAQIMSILRTGLASQIALIVTFIATLLLPVVAAVGLGVALSLLLQLNRESLDLRVVRLIPIGDNHWQEEPPPKALEGHDVVVLDVYGSLLYAGSRSLQSQLPDPGVATRSAVIVRLRGRVELGATFFKVIEDYTSRLHAHDGRVYLTGVGQRLHAQWSQRHWTAPAASAITVIDAGPDLFASTTSAYESAAKWVGESDADASAAAAEPVEQGDGGGEGDASTGSASW
jgi:SulP family sulfate permease